MTTQNENQSSSTATTSKGMLWTGRILSALPVLLMMGVGLAILIFKPDAMEKDMQQQGFPEGAGMKIMLVEMACVVIYIIPQTAVLGAILLTGYLGGATATHVRAGEPFFMPVIVGIVVWLGLFFRDARVRALIPLRR